MVYLLQMVIFHGELLNNQRVIIKRPRRPSVCSTASIGDFFFRREESCVGYGLVNLTSPEAAMQLETMGVALNHTLIDGLIISFHR